MRELFLVSSESTDSSLVFRTTADPDDSADQFFLAVNDELRDVLLGERPAPRPTPEPEQPTAPEEAGSTAMTADTTETKQAPPARPAPRSAAPRPQKDPDPRLSAPVTMRPREIQDRIRSGTSLRELADEIGVTEARIEPFAHPVLLERGRMAELAKQAHPVRDDGPAKLTLAEVLATAFAARGADLTAATWDTYRDPSGQWVIRVTWQVGRSDNIAEWTFQNHTTSSPTAVARNGVAADLTDPDFVEPVRSLTSVGSTGGRYYEEIEEPESHEEDEEGPGDSQPREEISAVPDEQAESEENELRRPEPEQAPQKRRRKAVTPHWEDVLLGVRTNTKRPKN